jgi:hypothetical protein
MFLERKAGALLLRLLKCTIRWEVINQSATDKSPCLYAFWHRDQVFLLLQRVGTKCAILVSSSRDGELIAGPAEELGYTVVRGSSTRGGAEALKALLRYSKTHFLAITPDGPKGPPGTIHPGLYQLAILGKIPIVCIKCATLSEWVFNSWDLFRFPKPFARIRVEYSDPIPLADKAGIPEAEALIRAFLAPPVVRKKI